MMPRLAATLALIASVVFCADSADQLRPLVTKGFCGSHKATDTAVCGGGFGASESGVASMRQCALRCLRKCDGCKYASYSKRSNDCSLYSSCDVNKLRHHADYRTAHVGGMLVTLLSSAFGNHVGIAGGGAIATLAFRPFHYSSPFFSRAQMGVPHTIFNTFARPLELLTTELQPPLPSFDQLISFSKAQHVLEIGCGAGRALVEATLAVEAAGHGPVCSAGLTSFNYSRAALKGQRVSLSLAELRPLGLGALLEERLDVAQLASTFTLGVPRSVPAIVDADFNRGLPFAPRSFDLVFSQASLKLFPDPTALFAPLADELGAPPGPEPLTLRALTVRSPVPSPLLAVRVLRRGGTALIQLAHSSHNELSRVGLRCNRHTRRLEHHCPRHTRRSTVTAAATRRPRHFYPTISPVSLPALVTPHSSCLLASPRWLSSPLLSPGQAVRPVLPADLPANVSEIEALPTLNGSVPMELAVGRVFGDPGARAAGGSTRGCPPEQPCRDVCAAHEGVGEVRGERPGSVCVGAFLYGTGTSLMLLVHALGGAAGSCTSAALNSPLLTSLLSTLPAGGLRAERSERRAVLLAELEARADALRAFDTKSLDSLVGPPSILHKVVAAARNLLPAAATAVTGAASQRVQSRRLSAHPSGSRGKAAGRMHPHHERVVEATYELRFIAVRQWLRSWSQLHVYQIPAS